MLWAGPTGRPSHVEGLYILLCAPNVHSSPGAEGTSQLQQWCDLRQCCELYL